MNYITNNPNLFFIVVLLQKKRNMQNYTKSTLININDHFQKKKK